MEKVRLTDALAYLKKKAGIDFERKTFIRYLESGEIRVDGKPVKLIARKIEDRWFVDRSSLDDLIAVINSQHS